MKCPLYNHLRHADGKLYEHNFIAFCFFVLHVQLIIEDSDHNLGTHILVNFKLTNYKICALTTANIIYLDLCQVYWFSSPVCNSIYSEMSVVCQGTPIIVP